MVYFTPKKLYTSGPMYVPEGRMVFFGMTTIPSFTV
jgi:hypothetical protein